MDKNNDVYILAKYLKQELAWIKELNTTLEEEKHALTKREFTKLEDLANKKQELSNKLENSSKDRMSLIGDPQTQSPSAFLNEFLKQCSANDANLINTLNHELAEQLVLCRDLNTVNGQVIATNIHTSQEVVNILSGNKVKDVSVYTATGDIKSSTKGEGGHHQKA
jgi:flagellar biosynthesis protein FlgN